MPDTVCLCSLKVTAYVISVPKQKWEFPILPWGKPLEAYFTLFMYGPKNTTLIVALVS